MARSLNRIRLLVSYDGTDYCGWQKQKDHAWGPKLPSVQQTLEQALERIFQHPIDLSASGRTDAGVHAKGQVCHFDTPKAWPRDLCWALKSQLPVSIAARAAYLVPPTFHSTMSATHKTYQYYIWNSDRPTALLNRYTWWIRRPLDLGRLQALSEILLGEHDFASFQSVGTPVLHTRRQILKIQWRPCSAHRLCFEITGTGFLKQMVRNIVGTLVDFHQKGKDPAQLQKVLAACDRKKAGPTAPAQGLFLKKVYYPKKLDSQSVKI